MYERLKAAEIREAIEREEEHSAWMVTYQDPTNATAPQHRIRWRSRNIDGCAIWPEQVCAA